VRFYLGVTVSDLKVETPERLLQIQKFLHVRQQEFAFIFRFFQAAFILELILKLACNSPLDFNLLLQFAVGDLVP